MNRRSLRWALAASLTLLCIAAPARNTALTLPIADVTKLASTRQIIGPDVELQFGKHAADPQTEVLGELRVQVSADPYEGSGAHRVSRGDEATCRDAFRQALAELSRQAHQRGANAIVGIVSDYNHVEMSHPTAYECHAGMTRAVVALKAQAARVHAKPPAAAGSGFAALDNVDAMPVNDRGRELYRDWFCKRLPHSFAIAPNGVPNFSNGQSPDATLPQDAAERALFVCNRRAGGGCKLYAVDKTVVWTP